MIPDRLPTPAVIASSDDGPPGRRAFRKSVLESSLSACMTDSAFLQIQVKWENR